jgi:26S proteasome regulatory subunit N9
MEPEQISEFLASQRDQAPSEKILTIFLTLEEYWDRKLWHQLTDTLVDFFRLPESAPQRLPIFKSFVVSFADKINQLKLVLLGLMASAGCTGKLARLCFASRRHHHRS